MGCTGVDILSLIGAAKKSGTAIDEHISQAVVRSLNEHNLFAVFKCEGTNNMGWGVLSGGEPQIGKANHKQADGNHQPYQARAFH